MTKHSQKLVPKKKRIPIWLPLIIVAGLAVIVAATTSSNNNASSVKPTAEVSGVPALQVDKEKVDFGNVTLGQTVEAKFEVTNVGSQPLLFKETPYVEVVEGC